MNGIVYTETIVHSAPADFVDQAPYQLVIVAMEDGSRITGRVLGDREGHSVTIGDVVALSEREVPETQKGIHFFYKVK